MSKLEHCQKLAFAKRERTLAKAINAIQSLSDNNQPVTFQSVSQLSGVSTSWLYKEPVIKKFIGQYQTHSTLSEARLNTLIDKLEKTLNRLEQLEGEHLLLKQALLNSQAHNGVYRN